jgi:hypothetical protein
MNASARLHVLNAKLDEALEFARGDQLTAHMQKNRSFWNNHLADPSHAVEILRRSRVPASGPTDIATRTGRSLGAFGLRSARADNRRQAIVKAAAAHVAQYR